MESKEWKPEEISLLERAAKRYKTIVQTEKSKTNKAELFRFIKEILSSKGFVRSEEEVKSFYSKYIAEQISLLKQQRGLLQGPASSQLKKEVLHASTTSEIKHQTESSSQLTPAPAGKINTTDQSNNNHTPRKNLKAQPSDNGNNSKKVVQNSISQSQSDKKKHTESILPISETSNGISKEIIQLSPPTTSQEEIASSQLKKEVLHTSTTSEIKHQTESSSQLTPAPAGKINTTDQSNNNHTPRKNLKAQPSDIGNNSKKVVQNSISQSQSDKKKHSKSILPISETSNGISKEIIQLSPPTTSQEEINKTNQINTRSKLKIKNEQISNDKNKAAVDKIPHLKVLKTEINSRNQSLQKNKPKVKETILAKVLDPVITTDNEKDSTVLYKETKKINQQIEDKGSSKSTLKYELTDHVTNKTAVEPSNCTLIKNETIQTDNNNKTKTIITVKKTDKDNNTKIINDNNKESVNNVPTLTAPPVLEEETNPTNKIEKSESEISVKVQEIDEKSSVQNTLNSQSSVKSSESSHSVKSPDRNIDQNISSSLKDSPHENNEEGNTRSKRRSSSNPLKDTGKCDFVTDTELRTKMSRMDEKCIDKGLIQTTNGVVETITFNNTDIERVDINKNVTENFKEIESTKMVRHKRYKYCLCNERICICNYISAGSKSPLHTRGVYIPNNPHSSQDHFMKRRRATYTAEQEYTMHIAMQPAQVFCTNSQHGCTTSPMIQGTEVYSNQNVDGKPLKGKSERRKNYLRSRRKKLRDLKQECWKQNRPDIKPVIITNVIKPEVDEPVSEPETKTVVASTPPEDYYATNEISKSIKINKEEHNSPTTVNVKEEQLVDEDIRPQITLQDGQQSLDKPTEGIMVGAYGKKSTQGSPNQTTPLSSVQSVIKNAVSSTLAKQTKAIVLTSLKQKGIRKKFYGKNNRSTKNQSKKNNLQVLIRKEIKSQIRKVMNSEDFRKIIREEIPAVLKN